MQAFRIVALMIGLLAGATVPSVKANPPSYLILRGPVAPHPHDTSQGYYPGYGYAVRPRAYAYGWFGAQPAKQWTRHFGYYRNYTEWSAR